MFPPWELSRDIVTDRKRADSRGLEVGVEVLEDVWDVAGWSVGVGRPVTCRINGCGGAAGGSWWVGGRGGAQVRWLRRRESGTLLRPRPEPRRSPEQQSHGANRTCQPPLTRQTQPKKGLNSIFSSSSKQMSSCQGQDVFSDFFFSV